MTRMIIVACSVLAVFGGCSYWLIFESEISSESYATYLDAERSGLFQSGWVPSYIPRSTVSISEVHDVDTNERCVSFSIDTVDRDSFLEALRAFGFRPPSGSGSPPPELSPLRSCPFSAAPREASIILRRPLPNSAEIEYFALFDSSNRVYFWSGLR